MAQPTFSEQKNRLITLCGLVNGIVTAADDYPEDNEPFAASQLPAIIVRPGAAVYIEQSKHRWMVTRAWQLQLLVQHVADDIQDPDTDAYEAVEPFLLAIMGSFGSKPRGEHNDSGLFVALRVEGDAGIGGFNLNSARYMGSAVTISTDTLHNVGR